MRTAVLAPLLAVLIVPAPALAGRLIVTGHDADRRCALMKQQCGFIKTAITYVRATAPHRKQRVLVLDHARGQLDEAITEAFAGKEYVYGAGFAQASSALLPTKRVDPRSKVFKKMKIDVKHFSAIAVASDQSCGGCDLTSADEAAIWKRRAVIQKFLNQGGGIYVGAGGTNAASYYRFLPLPAAGPGDAGPFQPTYYGRKIGFKASDLQGAVANTFAPPDVGRMDVAATSANLVGDTLIADGRVRKGQLVADATIPAVTGTSFVVQPVNGTVLGHPPDDPTFRRIVGKANLVMGWTLDVTKGRARLTTQDKSVQQSVDAYEGFFTIQQATSSPVTDLVLRSGNFDAVCGSGGVDIARAHGAANTTSVRHLWASGKGKFRTKGRFAAATVRGTEWETDDRCDGTLVTVKTGAVSVFDQVLQTNVVVSAGNSYLAKAP